MNNQKRVAFVLPGGGARAAYQLGVLKYIFEKWHSSIRSPIFIGVSAGAINSQYLVQHSHEGFHEAINKLCHVWGSLKVQSIYKTDVLGITEILWHWLRNFTIGRFVGHRIIESALDVEPLNKLLLSLVDLKLLHENIEKGYVSALGITATHYDTGRSITFFQASPQARVREWNYPRRQGIQTKISIKHILASASIPILFPAVKIGQDYYGDGNIRFSTPLSPAIHLGAEKICVIGLRRRLVQFQKPSLEYPSLAKIGGTLLNAIFHDSLDYDIMTLQRINDLIDNLKAPSEQYRKIDLCALQPSQDLGHMALGYEKFVPKALMFLLNGMGTEHKGSADLLSYLLFEGHYIHRLMSLGYDDAKKQHADLAKLFDSA
ncbi:MAG: patatin-like phospholipase family protein [Deltaproteobacteria bacterium]|nr:patatin-like phospholipase family protein [Deltaproteobacteria bacterium]